MPAAETDDARYRRVAAIFEAAGFLATLGVRLEAVGAGTCEASLPLTPALRQQHGFAHAGVITTLADHTAGGAAKAAVPPGRDVLTLEVKINFLRPGRGDRLVARGRCLRAGRTVAVSESEVFAFTDERTGRADRQAVVDVDGVRPASLNDLRTLAPKP